MSNNKIGIVGAGTMGTGIAQTAASAGFEVFLFDPYPEQLLIAESSLQKVMNRLSEKGKIDSSEADSVITRIHFTDHIKDFKKCGFVIEAIIEDLNTKKDQFARIEAMVPSHCILATNTSSLSIASISSALKKPERFLGVHFFNPAAVMKLVEVIPGLLTHPDTVRSARALIHSWGKTTVLAKDTPGFIVNRVARPFYGEALRILDEGIADVITIDRAMKETGGFRMGPFELMDLIGNDINYTVTETIFREFYYDPRYRPSFTQKRLVEAGRLGRKSGAGFYTYDAKAATDAPVEPAGKETLIFNRILCMLINEAADALFMNIASADDIDLAMTLGVNYPKGLLQWADELGPSRILKQLEQLQSEYGEDRYRPSPLLRKMAELNSTFF
ncbi:MAG: 3-hydroxybutyryl-CoA dehydrogenase [Balneolaceae bacterium]|nr:MAG: 3-hydroxybutyryl-CoA dehydrogenase [Balneolaceae bacterium]